MSTRTKIIAILGILIVLLVAILLIWNLTRAKQDTAGSILQKPQSTTQANNTPAVIILSASKSEVKVGENFSVSINISSRQPSDGTDIILLYDPKLLSVDAGTSGKPVAVGSIYPEYPINNDDKNGLIKVSGISSLSESSIASGLFGTVTFKANTAGKAVIRLDFTKGSTIDSNVIESESSNDILEAVQNVEVLIQ